MESLRLTTVPGLIEVLRRPLKDMPRELELVPLPGPFDVIVRPPGSKSLTNRVLLLAALATGESEIRGALLDADDAIVMIGALKQLGAGIEIDERAAGGPVVRVRGTGGKLKGGCTLNLKNAGTATRFLTAAACLADGPVVIDGNERMRQRPIGELVEMLRSLGVKIEELGAPGCVPLRVHPRPPKLVTTDLKIGATASSQFVSAMLMIGPLLPGGLWVEFTGAPTSVSYIDMTIAVMDEWLPGGVDGTVKKKYAYLYPSSYRARSCVVEPDASGATYFFGGASVISHANVEIMGLEAYSWQADARLIDDLSSMGCGVTTSGRGEWFGFDGSIPRMIRRLLGRDDSKRERRVQLDGPAAPGAISADLSLMPDAAMTLAAVACFAQGTTTITGLRTLRVKETDRLEAIRAELTKLGVKVEIFQTPAAAGGPPDEGIRITPPEGGIDCSDSAPRVEFDTYDDHRMAMSLALIGLRRPNVVIRDPGCVAKTYPTFWNDWAMLYESAAAGGAIRSNCG